MDQQLCHQSLDQFGDMITLLKIWKYLLAGTAASQLPNIFTEHFTNGLSGLSGAGATLLGLFVLADQNHIY